MNLKEFSRRRVSSLVLGTIMTCIGVLIAGFGTTPITESIFNNQDVAPVWIIAGATVSLGGVCLLVFGMMHVLLGYHGRGDGEEA